MIDLRLRGPAARWTSNLTRPTGCGARRSGSGSC